MTDAERRQPLLAALRDAPPEFFGYLALAMRTTVEQLEPEDGGFEPASRASMRVVDAAVKTYLDVPDGS